jgi:hypothetical protein
MIGTDVVRPNISSSTARCLGADRLGRRCDADHRDQFGDRGAGQGLDPRAWLYYVIAARWLALAGRFPWRLMGFLNHAYATWAASYRWSGLTVRHAELQDHLADDRHAIYR